MPLVGNPTTALQQIDERPSDEARKAADALVHAAISPESTSILHPRIPAFAEIRYSDAVESEHARLAAGESAKDSIDVTRYEALDAPEKGDLAAWRATLRRAYASVQYLHGRELNLGLLETYGKNAWLVSNSQLEDILKSLEKEVEEAKLEQEAVEQARAAIQQNVAGEMQSLEEGWKKGVGRMIETQAAAERLRLDILDRKRAGAS